MLNDAGGSDFCRKVNDRTDNAMGFNGRRNHAAGIEALETKPVPFAAETLEVPPGNSILRADHGCVWPQRWPQLRCELRKAVRLYTKKKHVHRPNFLDGAGDSGSRDEISLVALDLYSPLLHRAKMRAAG